MQGSYSERNVVMLLAFVKVSGSVWGGGDHGYYRAWRATTNGLESVAACHNDTLLCLDELSQVDPKEAGACAYMLANSQGKSRATREASLRKPLHWRLLFLSSGEITLSDKMAEDARGPKQTAGQQVRMVDVPALVGKHGLFENLHGFNGAEEFSKYLQAASYKFYGTPIRAFLARIAPDLEKVAAEAKSAIKDFVKAHCPADSSGQVQRVCGRFGLIAAGGELATRLGILPWPEGEATRAAKTCFRAWLDARGGKGASEDLQGIDAVRDFLTAHPREDHEPRGITRKKACQTCRLKAPMQTHQV